MAATVGPLAVKIVASAEGLNQGLQKVEAAVASTAAKVATAGAADAGKGMIQGITDRLRGLTTGGLGLGASLRGIAEKALGTPGKFIAEDILGGMGKIAAAVPVLGPLLALPFEGLSATVAFGLAEYEKGASAIKTMGAAARTANTEIGDFQVISALVGDSGLAAVSLGKMQIALQKAMAEGAGARNVFTRMGLDAMELETRGAAGAFEDIIGRIRSLDSTFAQTQAAREIFGKSGLMLMDAIKKGPEALQKVRRMLEGFGALYTEQDLQNVRLVDKAKKQIDFFAKGITNQITTAIAPVFAELAESMPKLLDMGITPKGLKTGILDLLDVLGRGVAFVVDLFLAPEEAVNDLKLAWEDFKVAALAGAVEIGTAIGDALRRAIISDGTLATLKGESPLVKSAVAKAVRKHGLFKTDDPLGMSGSDWDVFGADDLGVAKVRPALAAWEGFMNGVSARLKGAGDAARQNSPFVIWMEGAEEFLNKLESPMDKIAAQIESFQAISRGPAMMDAFDAEAGMAQLEMMERVRGQGGVAILKSLEGFVGGDQGYKPLTAMQQGSQEAFSVIQAALAGGENAGDRLERLVAEANRKQDDMLRVEREVSSKLDALKALKVRGS